MVHRRHAIPYLVEGKTLEEQQNIDTYLGCLKSEDSILQRKNFTAMSHGKQSTMSRNRKIYVTQVPVSKNLMNKKVNFLKSRYQGMKRLLLANYAQVQEGMPISFHFSVRKLIISSIYIPRHSKHPKSREEEFQILLNLVKKQLHDHFCTMFSSMDITPGKPINPRERITIEIQSYIICQFIF